MTNKELLKAAIKRSGVKLDAVLDATGIKSYATLRGRINNETGFTASEIAAIQNLLRLTNEERDEIFFAS